jgi:hypothetical protein
VLYVVERAMPRWNPPMTACSFETFETFIAVLTVLTIPVWPQEEITTRPRPFTMQQVRGNPWSAGSPNAKNLTSQSANGIASSSRNPISQALSSSEIVQKCPTMPTSSTTPVSPSCRCAAA